MTRALGHVRQYEVEARLRALRAARLAMIENISLPEAAQREDAKLDTVMRAFAILKYATPEEIATIDTGTIALRAPAIAAQARAVAEQRAGRKPNAKMNDDMRKQRDTEIALWNKLRDALDNIASMPQPSDVVRIVKKHHMREEKINEKLIAAFAWITEFSDAWTR